MVELIYDINIEFVIHVKDEQNYIVIEYQYFNSR